MIQLVRDQVCVCAAVSELRRGRADGLRDFKALAHAHPIPSAARRSIEAAGASQRVLEVTAAGPENEATSATKRATKRKRNIIVTKKADDEICLAQLKFVIRALLALFKTPRAVPTQRKRRSRGCLRERARSREAQTSPKHGANQTPDAKGDRPIPLNLCNLLPAVASPAHAVRSNAQEVWQLCHRRQSREQKGGAERGSKSVCDQLEEDAPVAYR